MQIPYREKVSFNILIADSDPVYRAMIGTAWNRNYHINGLDYVNSPQQLMDYLHQENNFKDKKRPDLIILEFNLGKVNGVHCLEAIKKNPSLSSIPIIILSSSKDIDDVNFCYSLGGSSYITKPDTIEELAIFLSRLRSFWFEVSQVPSRPELIGNQAR